MGTHVRIKDFKIKKKKETADSFEAASLRFWAITLDCWFPWERRLKG